MAEVSNHEDEFYHQSNPFVLDFDSFSPPSNSSNPSFFDDYTTSFDFGFDLGAETENLGREYEDPNCCFYGVEEDEEQMNFVTDLFESRETHVTEDPIWEIDSVGADDTGLEFGFGPGLGSSSGLRVVGMDSESDSEEFEVNSGLNNDFDDNYDSFGASNNNDHISENEREEFEWEEVSERVQFDERENLISVIDRIEEISVSSNISSEGEGEESRLGDDDDDDDDEGGEEVQNVEWQVLLAVNSLERNFEFDNAEETSFTRSEAQTINLPEDYILTTEYNALFGQLVENENALKGSPPAAKSVVENLPLVVLTKEDVGENNSSVVCAVCKDEVPLGEKMTRMPCCHLYHGECILTWLTIRNTCPVCRYELPTDDAEYERRRRSERAGRGVSARWTDDFEVTYNFELLP